MSQNPAVHSISTQLKHGDLRAPGALVRHLKKLKMPTAAATAKQIHSDRIAVVPRLTSPRQYPGLDGFLTDQPLQPLAIFTADCAPIFLEAGGGRVVGLLHAGWRGVQKKILAKAVSRIGRQWRIPPSHVTAWTGPHIGPCCFEVGWDVAVYFPASRRKVKGRWRVDLQRELSRQARRLGIRWVIKKGFAGCTMHEARFHSYRRNQTKKRQVSVIMKREPS